MKFNFFTTILLFIAAQSAHSQTVNWANDVAPILYENCVTCHRDGGLGHFSLVGYANAFSNRDAIRSATQSKLMPPWKPDPNYRSYAHENRLTDAQIATIKQWVDADAPPGDLNQAPADPIFIAGSAVGIPDLTLYTPFYTVTASDDEYRCFVIHNTLNQDAFLRGLEAIPSNHQVVHHILIYEDVSGQGQQLDAQTPETGYVSFGSSGVSGARLVGAWVPGSRTAPVPPFMGVKLTAGADLIVQMHYPKGTTGMSDQTALNFFFTPTNQNIREIKLAPILNHTPLSLENGPLNIPANTVKTYHAKFKIPFAASVVSVAPHMHLIGRSIISFAVTPQNDTIPLVKIDNWDFHWQGAYYFQHVQVIPAQSMLHAYAVYDNTENNPFQPSFPVQNVVQGEATTDEMMLVYFAYMNNLSGDQNILLDSMLLSSAVPFVPEAGSITTLKVFPNPVQDAFSFEYELSETADIQASIADANGRLIQTLATKNNLVPGIYRENANLHDQPAGTYFVQLRSANGLIKSTPFVKL